MEPFNYFHGEKENPFEVGTFLHWYWWDEAKFYYDVYNNPERYAMWKKDSEEDNKEVYPWPKEVYNSFPEHIRVMLTFAIWRAWNMNPYSGEKYLRYYGKSIAELEAMGAKMKEEHGVCF